MKRLKFSGYLEVADECSLGEALARLGIKIKQVGQELAQPSAAKQIVATFGVVDGPLTLDVTIDGGTR